MELKPATKIFEPQTHEETFQQLGLLQKEQAEGERALVTAPKNFPYVVAFDSPTCAYQITLNSKHKLNAKQWKKFLDACAEARGERDTVVDLYVLLPSRIYQQGIKPMAFSGDGAIINAPLLKPVDVMSR